MSATRDKSQKVAFVFSNFYKIYKEGKTGKRTPSHTPRGLTTARVISPKNAHQHSIKSVTLGKPLEKPAEKLQEKQHQPLSLIERRMKNLKDKEHTRSADHAVQGLKDNLNRLNELHSRLRFMLKELEELVRE